MGQGMASVQRGGEEVRPRSVNQKDIHPVGSQ